MSSVVGAMSRPSGPRHCPVRHRHRLPSNPGTQWHVVSAGIAWDRVSTTHTAMARSFTSGQTASTMNADVPGPVQILAELGLRDLSRPRRHTADHNHHTRCYDSHRRARPAPPRTSAPSPSWQALAWRKATAAVLGVTRAGLDQRRPLIVGIYRRHDACAAAAHSLSCG